MVGVGKEDGIDVLHVLFQLVDMAHVEELIPSAVKEEAELVHLSGENRVAGWKLSDIDSYDNNDLTIKIEIPPISKCNFTCSCSTLNY